MKKAVIFDFYGVLVTHGVVDPNMVEVLKAIRAQGLRLCIISNSNQEESTQHPQEFPGVEELFDARYYSWQTGFKKPDTQAFLHILEQEHLVPSEVVYFDDNKEHAAAAQSVGIESYVFEGPDQVKQKFNL